MTLFCSLASVFVILITFTFAPNVSLAQDHAAFFIFGDSTVDTGNNNYIDTTPENKANYPPYGRKGPNPDHQPTGRFSDGRVFVDFIAEYAQLPSTPPLMLGPPSVKEYRFGVNFGSGGAGVLPGTNRDQGVIDLNTQLKYFGEVQRKLKKRLGDDKAGKIISNAVYFISIGSDGYLSGYINGIIKPYPEASQYVSTVVGNLTNVIRELYNIGARKFGFLGVPIFGCSPFMKEQNGGGCVDLAVDLAYEHNDFLMDALRNLEGLLPDFKFCYSDMYYWLGARIDDPSYYGFKEGDKACCGTGQYNGIYSCGGKKNVTSVYQVCDNGDDYLFWDSLHLTEKVHEIVARNLWEGSGEIFFGYKLRELFLINNNKNNNQQHVIAAAAAGEA